MTLKISKLLSRRSPICLKDHGNTVRCLNHFFSSILKWYDFENRLRSSFNLGLRAFLQGEGMDLWRGLTFDITFFNLLSFVGVEIELSNGSTCELRLSLLFEFFRFSFEIDRIVEYFNAIFSLRFHSIFSKIPIMTTKKTMTYAR